MWDWRVRGELVRCFDKVSSITKHDILRFGIVADHFMRFRSQSGVSSPWHSRPQYLANRHFEQRISFPSSKVFPQ